MRRTITCLIGLSAFVGSLAVAATPAAAHDAVSTVVADNVVSADALAANPSVLSREPATQLVQSTGNLYWTNNEAFEHEAPSHVAKVFRASKSNTPGNERVLYQEARNDRVTFDALTYANVGGRWFGYFVVNYHDRAVSQIKRIPLEGGPAVVLATSPRVILQRDLVTDGSALYWADAGGLRKMPIGGGAITTLVSGTSIKHVGLDRLNGNRIFYSAGTSIRSFSQTTGTITTHVAGIVGSPEITALFIRPRFPSTIVYWGDANGAVKSRVVGLFTLVHQAPLAGRRTTSVSFDGTRLMWTDCVNGNLCNVRKRDGGTTTIVSRNRVGAREVLGDAHAMYWSDTFGVMKFTH